MVEADGPVQPSGRSASDDVGTALEVWRNSLVNLSGANRLINFRPTKTSAVQLSDPPGVSVLDRLRAGHDWTFQGENLEIPRKTPLQKVGVLYCARDHGELCAVVRTLGRKAQQEYLDRGLSVLYLAFGALRWQEDERTPYTSPLLLVPVEVEGVGLRGNPKIHAGEGDTVINPALALRLQEFGIALPTVDDLSELQLQDLFAQVEAAVTDRPGWTVTESVVLSHFSFHKEAMYRDLRDNQERLSGHPIVQALANQDERRQTSAFMFNEISPDDIDRQAPPEETPLVLDADSSQRACVAAAVTGRSFVMDGPPGTGKSQTITTMIGALLHAGKTVLFVSEKAAALEVVRNRLTQAGLGSYLLELHSHKTNRKAVAQALMDGLEVMPSSPDGMDSSSRRTLIRRRKQLNDYAAAMNRPREPFGRSLHHVVGQLAKTPNLPMAPEPGRLPSELPVDCFEEIIDAAGRLGRAWRPVVEGASFAWRDVLDSAPLDGRLFQAQTALETLAASTRHHGDLARAFDLLRPSQASILAQLLSEWTTRPAEACDRWLTVENLDSVATAVATLREHLATVERSVAELRAEAAVAWSDLPDPAVLPVPVRLHRLSPSPVSLGDLDAASAERLAGRFAADADRLEMCLGTLRTLTERLGLPAVAIWQEADVTLALAEAAQAADRPERGWLNPAGLAAAKASTDILRARRDQLATAESQLLRYFTAEPSQQSLVELCSRFTQQYRGWRKLSSAYRRDRRALAAITADRVTAKEAMRHLGLATAWEEARTVLALAETEHAGALGRYWQGQNTDFAAVRRALTNAEWIVRHTPPASLDSVADHICSPVPDDTLCRLAADTAVELRRWRSTLAPPPAPAAHPDLLLAPITMAVDWLRAHCEPLRDTAARIAAVDAATGRPSTLARTDWILGLRQVAEAAERNLLAQGDMFADVLGSVGYQGVRTNQCALDAAVAWARHMRCLRYGTDQALTDAQVKELTVARQAVGIAEAHGQWQSASERIVHAFSPSRWSELAVELDDYRTAEEYLQDLRADSGGQYEWFAYEKARSDLATLGLEHTVTFCIDQRLPADQVAMVIEHAVLNAWVNGIIHRDGALQPLRAQDRAALVAEYHRLDRAIITAATSDIIRAVNQRRPAPCTVGEPALIRREGLKKTRHIPVRELIDRTRTTTLAIKPCFLMSPLAVSQYLPADLTFDVVIFDEASQVTPGDAMNCVYRGNALITAGDDRQLPPTSFFDRMSTDEDSTSDVQDFQSILQLSKACGAFRNLGLRWHYRSRHENLIAYSNHAFYDGRLVTFPSAHTDGPDVGVEFIHVPDGVYRRGTSRDNPTEAEKVAERVLHHFTTRPDRSLGVVTFSVAQADAIEQALARTLDEHPDLERHLDGDRLTGFFVKSLESVQGDERDVMILSVGYGPDENGKVTSNFGAINKPLGWRRLNVAITRAKQRIEVVSSLRAADVPRSDNDSVQHLCGYLDYAERGAKALALDLGPTGLGTDSPFEDSVLDVIRSWGYQVEPQVGTAGYRIDLGVYHPDHSRVFALGVECDGAMYHSSPAARDRDRLREEVLRGLGWTLHRIWSTSWFHSRREEEERLRSAITAAITAPIEGRLSVAGNDGHRPVVVLTEVDQPSLPLWATTYEKATVPPLPRWVNPSQPESQYDMVEGIETVAVIEGPIHTSVLLQRLRDAWNIGRVGTNIRANIELAIANAQIIREGDFVDIPNRPALKVRTPAAGVNRTIDQIADAELRLALTNLVRDGGTVDRDEAMTAVARLFGWNRRGTEITNRFQQTITAMVNNGALVLRDQSLQLPG